MTTKTQAEIDLTPFVKDLGGPGRWGVSSPWVSKSWRYATDGHICVRVQAKGIKDDEGKHPDAAALFPRVQGKWLPFPKHSEKTQMVKCSFCNGHGKVTPPPEYSPSWRTCPSCQGTKEEQIPGDPTLSKRRIAGHYIAKINQLPNAKYCDDQAESKKPLRFRFAGGEGAVMAMDEGEGYACE